MLYPVLQQFLPAINALNTDRPLTKKDLITEPFFMHQDERLTMYYAPHNEYMNRHAKVIIVGITPGWSQMKTAYEQLVKVLTSGANLEACLKQVKLAAGFSGPMRTNLLQMLDECNLPQALHISNATTLFKDNNDLLHTTSLIKYPVFIGENNYTGHQPPIDRSSLLEYYAYTVFPQEVAQITSPAIIIPLGKAVDRVMMKLYKENKLSNHYPLFGFPHPSGANGHRIKVFQQQKQNVQEMVYNWMTLRN